MKAFLWNILLAIIWATMTEQFTPTNMGAGFVISYLILWFAQPVVGRSNYFVKVRQVLGLTLFFIWELIKASLRVAYNVVSPINRLRPGVIAVPLDAQTDSEITSLANLITLTPGSFSIDVSDDRKVMYIHAMYIDDADDFRREIKDGFERRVLEVLR